MDERTLSAFYRDLLRVFRRLESKGKSDKEICCMTEGAMCVQKPSSILLQQT